MDTKWLEDFIALAETHSFSRAAELRNVTQPAFSRRIQALETWLDVALIDRTSYPTRLTPAGKTFRAEALGMLTHLTETRTLLRGQERKSADVINIAMPHTLSLTLYPTWLRQLERRVGRLDTRVTALNVHDAAMRLVDGGCDLALLYHHALAPVQLDPARFDMLPLGTESIYPYARCGADGSPQHRLPDPLGRPVPFLAYTRDAYLNRMTDLILSKMSPRPLLQVRCETDMAEGLKMMALEGHGVAFLPESAVRHELRHGMLACAGTDHSVTMEVRLYRERSRSGNDIVDRLWREIGLTARDDVLPDSLPSTSRK